MLSVKEDDAHRIKHMVKELDELDRLMKTGWDDIEDVKNLDCALSWHLIVQVEAKLARRLEAGLKAWTQALVSEGTSKEEVDFMMDTDAPAVAVHRLGGDPKLKVMRALFYRLMLFHHVSCMHFGSSICNCIIIFLSAQRYSFQ